MVQFMIRHALTQGTRTGLCHKDWIERDQLQNCWDLMRKRIVYAKWFPLDILAQGT